MLLSQRDQPHPASRPLQSAVLKATVKAVVITDQTGTIIWVNSAFEWLTGYTGPEIVGQRMHVLKWVLNPRALYEEMWRTVVAGGIWRGEVINLRRLSTFQHIALARRVMKGDPIFGHHREQVGEVSLAAEHGMKGAGLLTFLSREAHAPEQVQEARLSVADNRLDLPWLNIRYVPRRQVMLFARPHTTMAPKQCTFATISGA